MRKAISLILLLVSLSSAPSRKEEVVYGLLNHDGTVSNLYVVNIFDGGDITDYGNYSEVINLTSSENISMAGDRITINTKADKFYYQGDLITKELPWKIEVKYFLDNRVISGEDLGGKSGSLKIQISVKKNDKVNSTFFDNYALQISLSLDSRLCTDIDAGNATVAEAGNKKQLSYTVLPGKGADIILSATVKDFEMDPISINGIRLNLDLNIDIGEFNKQIEELTNAIKELDDGAAGLLAGAEQLSQGMQNYVNGLLAFKNGLAQLTEGADKLGAGVSGIKEGLSGLSEQNASLLNGAKAICQATFDSVNMQLQNMGAELPVLTPENYSSILSKIPYLSGVKKQLDDIMQFTTGLESYLNGVSELDKGAGELVKGIWEYKTAASVIATSANELYSAGNDLNNGIKNLRDGLAAYREGTKALRDGTSDIDKVIEKTIDDLLGSISGGNDDVVSFVSDKNTEVSSVQFVLKTKPISSDEVQEPVTEKPVKLNFWQRLLKLFGLYK